eukprot:TRINITY_DN778235_c0_g1_i1.p1 TRINITY_DN778235_c0_g1~~TRINITY_DN778235_c0_g1_i1.p1  ORF type:complete len:297 (+),score=79.13 TRINITY_DN778235_c0_g1_i1:52-942(+)
MDSSFHLENDKKIEVKVHPVAVFGITEHHLRRKRDQRRVIGTLLGTNDNGVVHVQETFPVSHDNVDGKFSVAVAQMNQMKNMYQAIFPKLQVVGWYSTASVDGDSYINTNSAAVHAHFSKHLTSNPVHLVVDTKSAEKFVMKGYMAEAFENVTAKSISVSQFQEVDTQFACDQKEKIAMNTMMRARKSIKANDSVFSVMSVPESRSAVEDTLSEMLNMVSQAEAYVKGVVEGKVTPDDKISRVMLDLYSSLPSTEDKQFEELFKTGVQDMLLSAYLATVSRSQIQVAEKLNLKTVL